MSHEVETMAYSGAVPWHGLGTKVPADLTPEQMLEAAGLNWNVERVDVTYEFEGRRMKAGKKQALIRTSDGKMLDVVSEDWNPLQNIEAFEFFNDFVQAGDMEMHTAGSLAGGQKVWALAKVNDAFEVFKDDVVEQYLLFSNPHKYGMSIDVRMTPIRVVCNNTLTFALGVDSEKMVRVNHRNEFDADMVKQTLGVAAEKLETYKEVARFLGSKRFTQENLVNYFKEVFPSMSVKEDKPSRALSIALSAVDHQPGAQYGEGSWWQCFNAVTYMTDHIQGRNPDTRMTSAWFGANSKRKTKALEKAVEYAEKSADMVTV